MYLLSFNSQAIGIMVGSGVPDPMAALAAAPIILIPLVRAGAAAHTRGESVLHALTRSTAGGGTGPSRGGCR